MEGVDDKTREEEPDKGQRSYPERCNRRSVTNGQCGWAAAGSSRKADWLARSDWPQLEAALHTHHLEFLKGASPGDPV